MAAISLMPPQGNANIKEVSFRAPQVINQIKQEWGTLSQHLRLPSARGKLIQRRAW